MPGKSAGSVTREEACAAARRPAWSRLPRGWGRSAAPRPATVRYISGAKTTIWPITTSPRTTGRTPRMLSDQQRRQAVDEARQHQRRQQQAARSSSPCAARARVIPKAAGTAISAAPSVVSAAIDSELAAAVWIGSDRTGSSSASYQRSEKPCGGKRKRRAVGEGHQQRDDDRADHDRSRQKPPTADDEDPVELVGRERCRARQP